jgi:hypothetical protein
MGMCLNGIGRCSVEVRRESFVVHTDYGYTKDADGVRPTLDALHRLRRHDRRCAGDHRRES